MSRIKQKVAGEPPRPILTKQRDQESGGESVSNTFESVARDWHARYKVRWTEKHAQTVMRRLEIDLFPTVGKLPIKDISTARLTSGHRNNRKTRGL